MAFTTICNEKGYSKTGKNQGIIRKYGQNGDGRGRAERREWKKVREGIYEIERGEYGTFEEMKGELARRKLRISRVRQRSPAAIEALDLKTQEKILRALESLQRIFPKER